MRGNVKRTDFAVNSIYVPKGYFTPPFQTQDELAAKLRTLYVDVQMRNVGSIAYFDCKK